MNSLFILCKLFNEIPLTPMYLNAINLGLSLYLIKQAVAPYFTNLNFKSIVWNGATSLMFDIFSAQACIYYKVNWIVNILIDRIYIYYYFMLCDMTGIRQQLLISAVVEVWLRLN